MLIRLRNQLDGYHYKRMEQHGWLFVKVKRFGLDNTLIEARSIATGVICTLDRRFIEEHQYAEELQTGIPDVSGQAGTD